MSLESQRQLLEELNVLEFASAQRFRKNPELRAYANVRNADELLELKPKRPHRETLLQQHELAYFQKQYVVDAQRCRDEFTKSPLSAEISAFKDPDLNFEHILAHIRSIDTKHRDVAPSSAVPMAASFSMFLSAPKGDVSARLKTGKIKRKYHLSNATQHVETKLKLAFNDAETYGKYVDLSLFHEMYKSMLLSRYTYVEYLQHFLEFEGCSKTPEYTRYLESLLKYLKTFLSNAYPLLRELPQESQSTPEEENGLANSNGEVFCKACDKLFAKESVYKAHLSGKKHKKNEEKSNSLESSTTPNAPNGPKPINYKSLERQIALVASQLKPVLENTINDYQRRARFSDREHQLERIAIEGELSDYTALDSDSSAEKSDDDDDFDDAFAKDLPLGSDGIPIPLWLYKLQGLHRTYLCEVCGNVSYKGRQLFNKHFGLPKHVHGLLCLGVLEQDTALFANISTIKEVQELWEKVKESKHAQQEEDENTVEVEDEEGNVMSRKDYEELKKQGLI